MLIQTSIYEDGIVRHRNIEVKPFTRFTAPEQAEINDCAYCAHYLGRYDNSYICKQRVCPAEAVGYDATVLYKSDTSKEFKEVIA